MSNTPITGPTSTTATQPAVTAQPVENPGALLDRDAFLKLLVAQLKYQDPTKPVDGAQLVAQSAQLTMVDRLNEIAESLQAATASDRIGLAGSLVGRDITFVDELGTQITARVDAVRFDGADLTLVTGAHEVPLAAVSEVRAPSPAPTPPAAVPTTVPEAGATASEPVVV